MKTTTRTWLLLVAIAAIALFFLWPKRDVLVPAQVVSTATPIASSRPAAPARPLAYTVSDIDRDAIAQDLRIVDRIAHMQKQRGRDDLVLDDMQMIAIQSCGLQRGIASQELGRISPELSLSAVRRDPAREWAFAYLEQACAGLDVEALKRDYALPMPDWVIALRDKDEATAVAIALDDLHNAESGAALLMGLSFLERRGKSPLPTLYRGPDMTTNMGIVELAINPIRCRSLDMCGSQNVLVAGACLRDGCPRGTTMEQHWRSQLSPDEIETAMQLRTDLARYRASPMRR